MGRIDDHHIDTGLNQRLSAFKARIPHRRGRSHPQTAQFIFAGGRVQNGVLGITQGQQSRELSSFICDQKLFDPTLFHQAFGPIAVGRLYENRKVACSHHHSHRRVIIGGKTHISVGNNAQYQPFIIDHRKPCDAIPILQGFCIC